MACLQRELSTILTVPLIAIAQTKSSRTLRILATRVLGRWMPGHPELIAVVAALAEHDQDQDLRTYAAGLVAKLTEKQPANEFQPALVAPAARSQPHRLDFSRSAGASLRRG